MPFYKIEEMETKYSEVGPATAKTVAGDLMKAGVVVDAPPSPRVELKRQHVDRQWQFGDLSVGGCDADGGVVLACGSRSWYRYADPKLLTLGLGYVGRCPRSVNEFWCLLEPWIPIVSPETDPHRPHGNGIFRQRGFTESSQCRGGNFDVSKLGKSINGELDVARLAGSDGGVQLGNALLGFRTTVAKNLLRAAPVK